VNIEDIKSVLASHKQEISERFKVRELGIFGSYVRGEQGPRSDVDVLVEFSQPVGFFHFLDLEDYLESLIGLKVDLVTKKALKPRMGANIVRELVII
jgi:predicted nucleotidyltransferase